MRPSPFAATSTDHHSDLDNSQDFEGYARVKPFNLKVAPTWANVFREVVERQSKPRGELTFLDFGCGDGKYFPFLIGEGLQADNIRGVDVSRTRVERCHTLGFRNAKYIEKGATLPFADNEFDIVNVMEVVEHVPGDAIDAAFREISRVVRPQGVVFVSTPNYPIKRFYDLYDAVRQGHWKRLRDDPTHVTFYNHRRLRQLAARYFGSVENRTFKPGFLYRYIRRDFFEHKVFLVCGDKRAALTT
jgi:2-polyprenyl-3-methyl-5-hydroxy-6-metoxy-1,4-benzoquinol methylase